MGKHLDRANILLDLDKYDLAEQALRQEIAENPNSDLAYGSLARCLINQRKLGAETLETIEYALSLNAENDWLHYLFAVYLHMKGEFNQAQQAIGVAIELDPNSALYFDTLARILFDRGNDKFNTHSWRVLALIFVFSRGVLWPIGWGISAIFKSYWLRSYLQPVFAPLEKSLSLDPEYLSALNLQTQLLVRTNHWHRALASSLNALQVDPSDHIAHKLHGQILLRLGKYTPAVDYFQSALRIDPSAEDSKAGLLEATRSQYWIYPWISITNWRGRLVLSIVLILTIAIYALTVWFGKEGILIFTCLVSIPAMCLSFTAKPIFNLLLQFNPKTKLLITRSISIRNIIFGNYIASLSIALLGSIYLFTGLLILADYLSGKMIVASIWAVIAGFWISIVTCLPVSNYRQLRSIPVIYQLIICGLGLIDILTHLIRNDLETLDRLFFWFVYLSPLLAIIYDAKKSN
jgi:tetratricopeptide (TPR) repeat protein